MPAKRRDKPGQSSGGNYSGRFFQLLFHPVQDSVDHIYIAENNPGPHAVNGIFTNYLIWNFQTDIGELGGFSAEGI